MNFQEWFSFGTENEKGCFMGDAEMGWEACKEEVLKILKTKENFIGAGIKSAIKEIEEL